MPILAVGKGGCVGQGLRIPLYQSRRWWTPVPDFLAITRPSRRVDKPTVTLGTQPDPDRVSSFLNIRVADIQAVCAE